MNIGLYRTAVSMASHEGRLNVLAANLANVDTVGFKRELSAAQQTELKRRLGAVRGVVNESKVDFGQGNLKRTGRDLDLGIFGRGFFAIDTPNGEVYTRAGDFQLMADGVIVTTEGHPVAFADQGGIIDSAGLPVLIDGSGAIRQGQAQLGRLRIVDFENRHLLSRNRDGFWEAPEGAKEIPPTGVVHQGTLEESNSIAMEQVIELIALQRSFESVAASFAGLKETFERLTRPS